jgi:hypothetical protein
MLEILGMSGMDAEGITNRAPFTVTKTSFETSTTILLDRYFLCLVKCLGIFI